MQLPVNRNSGIEQVLHIVIVSGGAMTMEWVPVRELGVGRGAQSGEWR